LNGGTEEGFEGLSIRRWWTPLVLQSGLSRFSWIWVLQCSPDQAECLLGFIWVILHGVHADSWPIGILRTLQNPSR